MKFLAETENEETKAENLYTKINYYAIYLYHYIYGHDCVAYKLQLNSRHYNCIN